MQCVICITVSYWGLRTSRKLSKVESLEICVQDSPIFSCVCILFVLNINTEITFQLMIKISRFLCEYFNPWTTFVEGCILRRYEGGNFMFQRLSSILSICLIYLQALVCSLSALWWLPQHTQRGWGEVFLISSGFSTLEI